jgi:hypothetical protein
MEAASTRIVGGLCIQQEACHPRYDPFPFLSDITLTNHLKAMNEKEQSAAPKCTPLHDVNDPLQQEIGRLLQTFQYDIMGIIALGRDGIMRSLTADRRVLSAVPFRTFITNSSPSRSS